MEETKMQRRTMRKTKKPKLKSVMKIRMRMMVRISASSSGFVMPFPSTVDLTHS